LIKSTSIEIMASLEVERAQVALWRYILLDIAMIVRVVP